MHPGTQLLHIRLLPKARKSNTSGFHSSCVVILTEAEIAITIARGQCDLLLY